MAREAIPVRDIVGTEHIAERLRIDPKTISQWRARYHDFPEPFLVLGTVGLWDWADVEWWAKRRRKRLLRSYRPRRF